MKAEYRRLILALLGIAAVVAAALLVMSALKNQGSFFYAPSDVRKQGRPLGRAVRPGGMVPADSIRRGADRVTVHFVVGDGIATTPVTYAGIVPDLF